MIDIPSYGGEYVNSDAQLMLEGYLTSLAPELAGWNEQLRAQQLNYDQSSEYQTLKNHALTDLNKQWPYTGDFLIVTGTMFKTRTSIDRECNNLSFRTKQFSVASEYESNGFDVMVHDDNTPEIALAFKLGAVVARLNGATARIFPIGYARPRDVSLLIKEPVLDRPRKEDLLEKISEVNTHIQYAIYDPASSFYKLDWVAQKALLESIEYTSRNDILQYVRNSNVRLKNVEYVYTLQNNGQFAKHLIAEGDSIDCTFLDICILENMTSRQTYIDSSDELIDSSAGLCLVACINNKRFDKQAVFIPSSQLTVEDLSITKK